MQYELLTGDDCLLPNRVNLAMRHGWRPVGGASAFILSGELKDYIEEMQPTLQFVQAMQHDDDSARTVLELEEDNEHLYPIDNN